MEREQTTDVASYLNSNFSGVNVSESADNPFQLDINYHGFTASPLLGTPEGLSVYSMACASTNPSAIRSTGT